MFAPSSNGCPTIRNVPNGDRYVNTRIPYVDSSWRICSRPVGNMLSTWTTLSDAKPTFVSPPYRNAVRSAFQNVVSVSTPPTDVMLVVTKLYAPPVVRNG